MQQLTGPMYLILHYYNPYLGLKQSFLYFTMISVYGPLIGNIKQINMSVNYTNWFSTHPVCLSPLNLETGCVKAISYEHTDVYEGTDQSISLSGSPGILRFTGTNITLTCPATSRREDLKDTIIWYKMGKLLILEVKSHTPHHLGIPLLL